jgi:hypothetical protein
MALWGIVIFYYAKIQKILQFPFLYGENNLMADNVFCYIVTL